MVGPGVLHWAGSAAVRAGDLGRGAAPAFGGLGWVARRGLGMINGFDP